MIIITQFLFASALAFFISKKWIAFALLASLILWLLPGASLQLFIAGWIPALFALLVLAKKGSL